MCRGKRPIAQLNPDNAAQSAGMLVGESAQKRQPGAEIRKSTTEVGLACDREATGGPRTQMAKVEADPESVDPIRKIEAIRGKVRILRNRGLSFNCVASGSCPHFLRHVRPTTFPAIVRSGIGAASIFFNW